MGLQKLAAALKKEATLKEEAVGADAEREAARIIGKAEQRAVEMEEEISTLADKLKEREKLLKAGRARMIERGKITALHSIYADEVKAECKRLYGEFMQSGEYPGFVKNELQKAQADLGEITEIRADAVTSEALKGVAETVTDSSVEQGFIAKAHGGRVSIVSTFASRLERAWKNAAPEIAKTVAQKVEDEH